MSGKNILLRIQNEEIEKTGISSLKIAYTIKVFGYYLEVTNAHKDKGSLKLDKENNTFVNAERYHCRRS